MAEIVLLLAIKKIGAALANGAADQAGAQFAKYASQLSELQGSMGRVERELRVMHDVLCQMDIRNRNNQVYEGWLDGVRRVAHVMEDMVDEYLYLVGREHDIGCCFYLKKGFKKPRSLLSLNRIASGVKEIEKDLKHLSETKDRWVSMINNGDTGSSNYIVKRSRDLANISRSLDEEDLVGVDKNREKLKQWLAGDDLERSVIVLLGMGGLGKTALAANVYRKEREKFQCHAWVSISQTFSSEDVLRNIIKELFKDKLSVPSNIATMEIVSKCKGLPLAIVSVGSLLFVREKTVEEWRRINDQLSWQLIKNPMLGDVRNVLHLSFMYLPTYLKSCFLYCSLFPEDYLFHRKKLLRLWVAEGFIEERGESTLEEVADGYLNELVLRNMLQLVERNSFGRIRRFRMHDILRELAVYLCQQDSFGVTYEEGKRGGSVQKDGRRLVVHKLTKDIQQSFSSIHRLRSIIVLDNTMPSLTVLPLIAEKSRYMSVLELSGLPIEKIPDAIGDLFNLRYLGLRDSKVKLLPESIKKLFNLLTLDLSGSCIQELPRGIVKLKKLRHLFAEKVNDPSYRDLRSCSGVCIAKGLGNLTDLQTLQALEAQDESVMHFRELRQLRSLRIWNVKGIYCGHLCESLLEMQFLSFLSVSASDENEVLRLNVLPPSLQKLRLRGRLAEGTLDESPLFQGVEQNLYSLGLHWSQLREDPLPSLSRLSNLTHVNFNRAYNGEQLVFLTGWFPKLKILFLVDLPNLKQLEIQQGAMASLEELILVNLSSMTEVPRGIEFLATLKDLGFQEITPDFFTLLDECSRIRGMGWWYSLRH